MAGWKAGEAATLIVSTGPQLFAVPPVVGRTRDEAKQLLANAGFQASYNAFWNFPGDSSTKVTGQNPDSSATCNADGTMCARGSTIDLTISGSF